MLEAEALEVLRSIRDEVRTTNARLDQTREELSAGIAATNSRLDQTNARLDQSNARLDQTNARLDQTNARLDQTREELSAGISTTNARLDAVDHTLVEISEQQRFIVRGVKSLAIRDRRFDRELEALRVRVEQVEDKLGRPDRER